VQHAAAVDSLDRDVVAALVRGTVRGDRIDLVA